MAGAAEFMQTEVPKMPSELKLANGKTLKRVEVVRWEKEAVVVKYIGGASTIQFRHIDNSQMASVLAAKDFAATEKAKPAAAKKVDTDTVYTGQVYTATAGAGAYKFSNVLVEAFPSDLHEQFIDMLKSNLPMNFNRMYPQEKDPAIMAAVQKTSDELREKRIASARTDAEGRFTIAAPGHIFLVSTATRVISFARAHGESSSWIIVPEGKEVLMSNANEFRIAD